MSVFQALSSKGAAAARSTSRLCFTAGVLVPDTLMLPGHVCALPKTTALLGSVSCFSGHNRGLETARSKAGHDRHRVRSTPGDHSLSTNGKLTATSDPGNPKGTWFATGRSSTGRGPETVASASSTKWRHVFHFLSHVAFVKVLRKPKGSTEGIMVKVLP